ncbi:MAG: multicopper oxidase family protein [Betaproteobacteria bacterium]
MTTRRHFIAATAVGVAAAGMAAGFWWRNRPGAVEDPQTAELPILHDPLFPDPLAIPGSEGLHGILDMPSFIALAGRHAAQLARAKAASLLAYECEHQGRTFLNPTLRVRSGATVGVKFWNALSEPSIIHWHGLKVDSNNDGHPHYAVPGGATYDYHYTVANRAATYWYHPHPHHLAGKQTYLGLAGLFIVEDDDELRLQQVLDLRLGESDIPLVIQDRRLDGEARLLYAPDREARVHGYFGDQVVVNHVLRPHLRAASRIYRFRIVNGSNARMYRLAFLKDGSPLTYHVIGNDGGLLERPYAVTEAFVAPAERLDVLLDLRGTLPGHAIVLASLPFDPMHHHASTPAPGARAHGEHHKSDPAGGENHHARLADGSAMDLLKIIVTRNTFYDAAIPQRLSSIESIDARKARLRLLKLEQVNGAWRINGLAYDERATPIVVRRGSVEVWEFRNAAQSMPHPMHVHGFQFQVRERTGSPEQQRRIAVDEVGRSPADLGWKDTVLVWPGETVRVVLDFTHGFLGDQVYMVHCHNLEHEDGGMMLNFKVAAS